MASVDFVDGCRFLAVSSGTGDFVVSAAVQGYNTPANAGAITTNIYYYRAESGDLSQWEEGYGAYTSGSVTLARTTIVASSSGTSKINFSSAPQVGIVVVSDYVKGLGLPGSRNLIALNNAASPTTKMDVSADLVTLRSSTGALKTISATGTLTCDTGAAGPAANGRDQAGAFSASTWLHFYFIWGLGQSIATIVSTVDQGTGPTLPANYTHWCYIGAVRFNGSSALVSFRIHGILFQYTDITTDGQLLNASPCVNNVETSVSTASFCPPNALQFLVLINVQATSASSDIQVFLRTVTGKNTTQVIAGIGSWASGTVWMPNIAQNVNYFQNTITTVNIFLRASAYTLPNGGS